MWNRQRPQAGQNVARSRAWVGDWAGGSGHGVQGSGGGVFINLPVAQRGERCLGTVERAGVEAVQPGAAHRLAQPRQMPPACQRGMAPFRVPELGAQTGDLLGEQHPGLRRVGLVQLQSRHGLRRRKGRILPAAGQGRPRLVFQVGDPRRRRRLPPQLRRVLRHGHRQRALGCLDRAGGVSQLLVKNRQCIPRRQRIRRLVRAPP